MGTRIFGDLVYKLIKNVSKSDFFCQFRKVTIHYKRTGYDRRIMLQSACLAVNPIKIKNFDSLFFNCTPVGRASDSMMGPA